MSCYERVTTDSTCNSSLCNSIIVDQNNANNNNNASNANTSRFSKTCVSRTTRVLHRSSMKAEEPIAFQKAKLDRGKWVRSHNTLVHDPSIDKYFEVSNVLFNNETITASDGSKTKGMFGYWIRETIRKALFGKVVKAYVLRRRPSSAKHYNSCKWELFDNVECAVKVLTWSKIQKNMETKETMEDPLKEIAAMQCMKRCMSTESHVLTPIEILADSKYIFCVMPLCKDGELYDRLEKTQDCFGEGEARYWFRQIIEGVNTLHRAQVCHRDISLENVLIHGGSCHIIDMGMSLRIPQHKKVMEDSMHLTEEERRIREKKSMYISPQGRCGKFYYMAPEIYANKEAFNPYAIDIWSAGAVLFMMLTGAPPYERASYSDSCFQWIASGRLSELLSAWGRDVSTEAIDLLQGMLCVDPSKRLTTEEVLRHPWVVGMQDCPPPPSAPLQ